MGLEWEFMQTVMNDRLQAAARENTATAAMDRRAESPRRRLPLMRRRQRLAVGCLA